MAPTPAKGLILAGRTTGDALAARSELRSGQLVPVANKPLLFYGLDAMCAAHHGRDARVYRDFALPRAMRLRLSDRDEIALT